MQQKEARRGDQSASPRRSGDHRQPVRRQGNTTMVGTSRRQPSTLEEHTTNQDPNRESNTIGVIAPSRGGVRHPSNTSSHPTNIVSTHENTITRGNVPSWGGGGHLSTPQAQVHHTIIAPSLQTNTVGLNAPSLSGGVRSLITQGHHTHVASTPENNTTTNAPTVGPENRAIHVPRENPRGEP
ncbi:hypothetical protein ACQJBY_064964 [Aegilops geniculata]